ncbi:MAG: hypothetical protein ACE5R6_20600 [Candidatus Heimdallarchaeota archaeon]
MKLLNRPTNRNLGVWILFVTINILLLASNTVVSEVKNITINSDAYADSVIRDASKSYTLGEYALGPPDGQFALISINYEEGYLTLDMGEGEDIVDGNGNDFIVVAQGGRYITWVSYGPGELFKKFSVGNGNQSFDLASVNLFNARYVQIQWSSGDDIELDAIVAINYITGEIDIENPRIAGLENFWIWENQTSTTLTWQTFDATPHNYSILINGELTDSGPWDGSDITYEFSWPNIGEVQVTLLLYDTYGNHAEDSVTIEIRPLPTPTTTPSFYTPESTTITPTTVEMNYLVLALLLGIALVLIWRRLLFQRRK